MERPQFQSQSWCGLPWGPWVPFIEGDFSVVPNIAGLYRVRPIGRKELAYIGQTGISLRARLKSQLCNNVLASRMPWNDPHTAAPCLWAFRRSNRMEFECSAAPRKLSVRKRKALESYLLWAYRLEHGESPLGNLGRFHKRYTRPSNRNIGRRGRHLRPGEKNNSAGVDSTAPLRFRGLPQDADWMGLNWQKTKGENAPQEPGLYKVLAASTGDLLYVGMSKNLHSRLASHKRKNWRGKVIFWIALLEPSIPDRHLQELENDLIGGYYKQTSDAPMFQFSNLH